MTDTYRWQRRAASVLRGAVAIALLWPCVALVRGTTAHDWYAAVKLTVTEAMIAAGANPYDRTRYRPREGTSYRITRGGLVVHGEPIEARDRILYTAAVGALHGALAGALCVVLFIMLWRAARSWGSHRAGWRMRPPDRGPPGQLETWDRSGIAEGLPANVPGGGKIALWVLSSGQSRRLVEELVAVQDPRAIPAQRSVERANKPLLLAADAAGATADTAVAAADGDGTKPETAGATAETVGASAEPGTTAHANSGSGSKTRTTTEAVAPEPEAGQADPENGDDLNWI